MTRELFGIPVVTDCRIPNDGTKIITHESYRPARGGHTCSDYDPCDARRAELDEDAEARARVAEHLPQLMELHVGAKIIWGYVPFVVEVPMEWGRLFDDPTTRVIGLPVRRSDIEKPRIARDFVGACPECVAGKHGNCDGTTWDDVADAPADCPCAAEGHRRITVPYELLRHLWPQRRAIPSPAPDPGSSSP